MRLKLKSDTFFIPMGESLYLRNNEQSMAMKGKALADWLERLTPVLDGQHDLTTICQTFPEAKRPLLKQFLLALTEHGYLKDTTHDLPHTLSAETVAAYEPAITFIDAHTDSGGYRFERFLTTPVLAIASGECLLALAHALLETGNRAISLLDSGEEETSAARLAEILEVQQERDRQLSWTLRGAETWQDEEEVARLCASAQTVLYFGTARSLADVARLAEYCQRGGVSFLPALIFEDEIHIGPFQHPDYPGCWQCYWRRSQAARGLPAYTAEGAPVSTGTVPSLAAVGKPAPGIVANMLAFEFFKYATDVRKNTLDGMVRVLELERLQSVKHQLFPHPLCTLCSAPTDAARETALAELERLRGLSLSVEPPNEEEMEQWIDKNSGIFTSVDDRDYHQLPLVRSQIEVPLASEDAYELPVIRAAGLDYAEVRGSLLRQAAGRYLTSLADERRACRGTYEQFQDKAIYPAWLSGWQKDERQTWQTSLAWIWGAELITSDKLTPVLLPGAALAPYSSWNDGQDGPLFAPQAGATGVAVSWSQALAEGLAALSLTLAPPNALLVRRIAPDAYSSDELCTAYLTMLNILGERVTLLEQPSLPGIPGIAIYVNERCIGLTAHWNMLCAVRQALQRAVLAAQIRRTPGPGEQETQFASPAHELADLPDDLPISATLGPSLAEAEDYVGAWPALLACLQEHGWRIAVAALSRDRTLERVLPCALRVLALRREGMGTR